MRYDARDMTPQTKAPRSLMFYFAVGASALCLLVVGVIVVRAMTASPNTNTPGVDGAFTNSGNENLLGDQAGAKGLQIQVMDRDNPERLSAEFRSETITPLQAQRYDVTQPRATFYLDDGRVAVIRADGGTMVMPDRTRTPETGTLRSNVVVRLFNVPVGGGSPDPDNDEPAMTWTGTSLTFDATLGEISTTEPFVLTSPGYEFRAADAKVLINQALERLELLTVRQGGTLVAFATDEPENDAIETEADEAVEEPGNATDNPTKTASAQGGNAAQADPPAPPAPIITLYQSVMRGDVRLERTGQHIASDRLDMYARTIDNALPDGAIAAIDIQTSESVAEAEESGNADVPMDAGDLNPAQVEVASADQPGSSTVPSGSDAATPEADPPAPTNDTTLRWTGLLEIRPLAAEPAELVGNDLLARFTAERSGVVTFADAASEANGQAAVVEYGFTTQDLVLTGPSQESSVFLTSPKIGRATMGRLELNLGTGAGVVPGPFGVVATDNVSKLDARERTTLHFASRDGQVTGELREVVCVGSVIASDSESTIKADFLHAFFDVGKSGSTLRRLIARDTVDLSDSEGNGGTCDALDVAFAPNTDEPVPTSFDAQGRASFRDRTARVDAEHLYATLRTPEDGSLEVVQTWADGNVRFRRYTDQVDIRGQRLFANLDQELLEVEDESGMARVSRGPTEIEGEAVRLDGTARTVFITGPGRFRHSAGRGDTASSIDAAWTVGMAFDDRSGLLEAAGDVDAVSRPDPWTRETIAAAELRVELAPYNEPVLAAEADDNPDTPLDSLGDDDREILKLYAASALHVGEGDALATIESARFTAPLPEADDSETEATEEPPLERAFRLSGTEILADSTAGTLDVPGRGRLFVADLRAPEPDETTTDEDQRGAALFDWAGSLHADRARGHAEMHDSVQMSHTSTTDGSRAVLESMHLRINFAPSADDAPEKLFGGLRSAVATENVYLRSDARELTADVVEYDPDAGIARALAEGFGTVSILDRQTGSPMTASALIWDLINDRVDIVDPSTIVIPR